MSLLLALARLIDAINEKVGLAVSWALLLAVVSASVPTTETAARPRNASSLGRNSSFCITLVLTSEVWISDGFLILPHPHSHLATTRHVMAIYRNESARGQPWSLGKPASRVMRRQNPSSRHEPPWPSPPTNVRRNRLAHGDGIARLGLA